VNEAAEVVRQGAIDDTNLIFGQRSTTAFRARSGSRWLPRASAGSAEPVGRSPSTRGTPTDDGGDLEPPSFLRDL
jgi:hypothetical protein